MTVPRFAHYVWNGREEPLLRFGPDIGPQLLIVPPLFEELNRCRKAIGDAMRALATRGVGSALLDLPGTGESLTALESVSWADWTGVVAAAAEAVGATHRLSIRGGSLIDGGSAPLARLAPVEGKHLLRDMIRARSLNDPAFDKEAQARIYETGPTLLGGYPLPPQLASALCDADPDVANALNIRLETDPADADARIESSAPWRRAEPTPWPDFSSRLAGIIHHWING